MYAMRRLSALLFVTATWACGVPSPDNVVNDASAGSDAATGNGDAGMDAGKKPAPDADMDTGSTIMPSDAGMDGGDQLPLHVGLHHRPTNVTCVAPSLEAGMPAKLSQTGCFDATDPTRPYSGLIPFDLIAPLWSDGASKRRWMALPSGATIKMEADGDFTFPPGTMLIKEFRLGTRRLETRFFVHHPASEPTDAGVDDGGVPQSRWVGYAYQWNAEQTDADLVPAGVVAKIENVDIGGGQTQTWQIPTRTECMTCHTVAVGINIGPEIRQLNRDLTYPATGLTGNELATLEHIGVLATPLPGPTGTLTKLASYADESATLEDRAKAYLHVNCSMCHRKPANVASPVPQAPDDFRADLSFKEMQVCDVTSTSGAAAGLGIPDKDPKILRPGEPDLSILWLRMGRRGDYQMPPIGSKLVDTDGKELLRQWIESLAGCP